jgi:hypothetical protein
MVNLEVEKRKGKIAQWYYTDKIAEIETKILRNSTWYKMVQDKSGSTKTSFDEVLFNEASYIFNKEHENNKTFPIK